MVQQQKKLTKAQMDVLAALAHRAVQGRAHVRIGGNANTGSEITRRTADVLLERGLIRQLGRTSWRPECRLTKAGIDEAARLVESGAVVPYASDESNADLVERLRNGDVYTLRLDVRWRVDIADGGQYTCCPVGGGSVYRPGVDADISENELRAHMAQLYHNKGWDQVVIENLLLRSDYEDAAAEVAAVQAAVTVIIDSAQTKLDCVSNRTAPVTALVYLDDAEAALADAEKEWARADAPARRMQRSLPTSILHRINSVRRSIVECRARLADPTANAARVAARELAVDAKVRVGRNDPVETTVTVTADEFARLVELACAGRTLRANAQALNEAAADDNNYDFD